ncbi:MAG: four helix bundle protein [Pirellulaceae bacterium]
MRMEGLRERTKQFALRVVRLYTSLPVTTLAQTLGKQVLRSGTSVAANFREASRARSSAEFISKLGIVEQELDETALWLELLEESGVFPKEKLAALRSEADELIRIVVASIRRSKSSKSKATKADS